MNTWLTHSIICYRLLHDFTYSLRFDLAIFVTLVVMSLACSIIINIITAPIEKRLAAR